MRKLRRVKKPYLVIGIDFGTTFTGISYGWSAAYNEKDDIIAIDEWPALDSDIERAVKVPTQIAYERDETGTSTNCWGYLIKPGVKRCVWMKLILDKNARVTEHDDPDLQKAIQSEEQRFPRGKKVFEITIDFFRELYHFTMETLRKDYDGAIIDMTPIKYWFTMPAIWSDEAQQKTLEAARKGGFGARRGDDVAVIAEPEAAAFAVLTGSWPLYGPEIDPEEEGVLVCDCGGGTVDLTAYTVVRDDPWELKELMIGDGGKCGATNLDRNLHKLLSRRFKDSFDKLDPSLTGPGSLMMRDFEYNKRKFGEPNLRLVPLRVFMDEEGSPHYNDEEGLIFLTDTDMKEIFDPVVERVQKLIAGQVETARARKTNITYLLLVGGLGDSPYLRKELGQWCHRNQIQMGGPKSSWGAVVNGAVVRGLELATVVEKNCRRHYGMAVAIPYEPQKHGPRKNVFNCPFTKMEMVPEYMIWSIRRGTMIKPEDFKPLSLYQAVSDRNRRLHVELKSCSLENEPEWFNREDVENAGKIVANLADIDFSSFKKSVSAGTTVYRVEFALEIVLGHRQGTVGFRVRIGEQVVGQTSVTFEESKRKPR